MSIVETALIFAGIPVAFFAVVAALIFARGTERTPRYRPGNPWPFRPVWYLPHPDHAGPVSSIEAAGVGEAGARLAITGKVGQPVTASGGASGEW